MNEGLTDLQFRILDALYFVEPFRLLLEEVEEPRPILVDELRNMIDKGWIQVMVFDEDKGDFMRTSIYDSDNLHDFHFLATKEGLLRHNGH